MKRILPVFLAFGLFAFGCSGGGGGSSSGSGTGSGTTSAGSSGSSGAAGTTGSNRCTGPADCPITSPGCGNGFCGFCDSDPDCPSGMLCGVDGACHCLDDSACGGAAPKCLTPGPDGVCGCAGSADCGTGRVCDRYSDLNGACVSPCTAGSCDPGSATPVCDTRTSSDTEGICVACVADADCTSAGTGTYCTPDGCQDCRSDSDCAALDAGTPFCSGVCVQCRSYQDCAPGEGCSTLGACGGCSTTADCPPGLGCGANGCAPLCIEGQSQTGCAPCQLDFDCPGATPYCSSGVCSVNPGTTGGSSGGSTGTSGSVCGGVSCAGVCDTQTNTCVECVQDTDCADRAATPVCNTTTHTCVQCNDASDCPFDAPGCSAGVCGHCSGNGDCSANQTCVQGLCQCSGPSGCGGDAPTCVGATDGGPVGTCGCLDNSDCGTGLVCNQAAYAYGACVANCATGGTTCVPGSRYPDCQTDVLAPTYGSCVPCVSDSECANSGDGPYCSPYVGCVQCRDNADCTTPGRQVCIGICVECGSFSDCGSGEACNSATFTCGTSCLFDQDCPSGSCVNGSCG